MEYQNSRNVFFNFGSSRVIVKLWFLNSQLVAKCNSMVASGECRKCMDF